MSKTIMVGIDVCDAQKILDIIYSYEFCCDYDLPCFPSLEESLDKAIKNNKPGDI